MNVKPQVLILGAGFAGLGAAEKLAKSEAEITLIDMHNYHTFQPMLYQVATDLVATEQVGHPLRDVFRGQPNLRLHTDLVTGIDPANRQVWFQEIAPITYDYLVLALGARVNFFGVKGAEEHGFPLYTLPDAVRLKLHILERWEAADKDPSIIDDGALDVVVVGGGPTGVESAGAIIELYRGSFIKDYPDLPAQNARVILVEFAPKLLGMFKKDVQTYTKRALEKRGVEVWLGDGVVEVTPTRVTMKSGKVINAHTLVWGAGLQGNPLVHSLGVALQKGERVPIGPDLSVEGHPEVFVVGDMASITDAKTNQVLPQLGSVALQSGELAGENIAHRLSGEETKPFVYFDKGMMATIGRGAAVMQMPGGKTMKGKMAALAWGTVHLALLTGGDSRTKTMIDWGWAGFTRKRTERISVNVNEK
jgi:NADH:ubiquinone reductase (H+-translocating)